MTKLESEKIVRELMDSHGLLHWKFRWSQSKRYTGLCRYPREGKPGFIELSLPAVRLNCFSARMVRGIALHEIAHAMLPPVPYGTNPHNEEWEALNEKIGGWPCRSDPFEKKVPVWVGICPCRRDKHIVRFSPPKKAVECKSCKTPLAFFS